MNSGYKLKVALRVPAISAGICLNSIIVYPILSHLSTPRRIKNGYSNHRRHHGAGLCGTAGPAMGVVQGISQEKKITSFKT